MRYTLGAIKTTINFNEFVSRKPLPRGQWPVERVYFAGKYPNGTIVFDTGAEYVRRSVKGEILQHIFSSLNELKTKEITTFATPYFFIDQTGQYGIFFDAKKLCFVEFQDNSIVFHQSTEEEEVL